MVHGLKFLGCLVNRRPSQGCVGFGGECKLSKDQVFEIAHGIVLFELPFLRALRKPSCAVHDLEAMAAGFHDRTSKQGLVLRARD